MAVQGPKADKLIARVFGENSGHSIFSISTVLVEGHEMVIARSGWSHQGGFEIYLDGSDYGEAYGIFSLTQARIWISPQVVPIPLREI
ncbi:MAG: hypothetical protein CM1200mP41_17920 [Gammaproteobacteria bacterium]|nr:MAG: hypothetical protein CM1200mP41_17920 [Gammaproteobacteria bacterium]